MPESTTIQPMPVVTSEAPQSRLSGAEIAQPYHELAEGLDKLGQGAEAVAVPLAERAGAEAVTRAPDGSIQVEHMPEFGLAGQAYARAVKMGVLAEADGEAKRADIAMREQYRDNPQGYANAAQAYRDKTEQNITAIAGPEVGKAVGRAIDSTTTLTFRGLQSEKERLDLQRANNSIQAGITSARDDAMAMARGGAAADDPALVQAIGKYSALINERASNPRLAYTPAQRDLDLQQFQSDINGARNLYHVDQVYKTQGYPAAMDAAKDVLTNPSYKLSPQQREAFYHQSVGEIRANEAIRRQDIGQAQMAFRELRAASEMGQRIEPEEVDSLRAGFRAANYPAGIAAVDAFFAHHDLHDAFGSQPLADQTTQLHAIGGAAAARDAYQFFRGRGYSDIEASGIVGNLVFESGMRPGVMGDNGTSGGVAQFHNERLAALKSYAAAQGKPWTDFQTQLEYIDKELQGPENVARALLRTATTPEQAASAFASAYERPAGTDYSGRQKLARSIFAGASADGSGGPGVASWLQANRAATVNDTATRTWKQAMTDWASGKGAVPSRQATADVLDAARATNNIDLMARVQRDSELIDDVQRLKDLPLDQQAALETELRRRNAEGSSTPGADLVLKQLQARTQAITKGIATDPIATTVANTPSLKTPPPLDLSNPQAFAGGLAMRAQIAQIGAGKWQTGPLSALDSADLTKIKGALDTADPAAKAAIFQGLATLPPDVRGATLKKLGGNDPKMMATVGAGSLLAAAPEVATSVFRGMAAIQPGGKEEGGEKVSAATKILDPAAQSKNEFTADMGKFLPSGAFSLQGRTDPIGPFATMTMMVRARYADLSALANDTKYSSARLAKAVDDVTGGILDHNDAPFIAPARGMTQGQFDGVMAGMTDKDLAGVTTLNGQPVTADYLRGRAQLESAGDGRYFVRLGRDPAHPIYAYQGANSEMPAKFVLDLRGRQPGSPVFDRPTVAVSP